MASDIGLQGDLLGQVVAEQRLQGRRTIVAVVPGTGGRHFPALGASIGHLLSRGDGRSHGPVHDDFQETLVDVHRCEL